jgi:hypothetical protein
VAGLNDSRVCWGTATAIAADYAASAVKLGSSSADASDVPPIWPIRVFVLGLVIVAGLVALFPEELPEQVHLSGKTAQAQTIDLTLAGSGMPGSWRTKLTASCDNGQDWSINWSPADGQQVHVRGTVRSSTAHEVVHQDYSKDEDGVILATLAARLSDDGRGLEGVMRMNAVFRRRGKTFNRCRAADVPWSAQMDRRIWP